MREPGSSISSASSRANWAVGVLVGAVVGTAAGVGGYTFVYAKGGSYLTNDPKACANCHIMNDQYDAWLKSSHRHVAVCNDCHTPKNLVGKYLTKASNGWHHSYAFTTGDFHEPIRITEHNREITEKACRKCHENIVRMIDTHHASEDSPLDCIRCHSDVGHRTH